MVFGILANWSRGQGIGRGGVEVAFQMLSKQLSRRSSRGCSSNKWGIEVGDEVAEGLDVGLREAGLTQVMTSHVRVEVWLSGLHRGM